MLIGYDPEFKYGQNFYLATTVDAKDYLIKVPLILVSFWLG